MSNTGLNLIIINLGYFLVKTVGILFLSKRDIVTVEQENLNFVYLLVERETNLNSLWLHELNENSITHP